MSAPDSDTDFWGTLASSLQTGITISDGAITGTLKYLSTGALATDWGAGNFLALAFTDLDERAATVKVGLRPSQGSGLVDIVPDEEKMGVFKITDKDTQKFVIESADPSGTKTVQIFDLSGLTVEDS